MKINAQYQSLHVSSESLSDWIELQCIERDICLLYHQLAEYSYIMEDLYYGTVFDLPYWRYLLVDRLEEERGTFIRTGCLVMIFAMVSEEVGGAGNYLSLERTRYNECRTAVFSLQPKTPNEQRLLKAIQSGFHILERKEIGNPAIYDESTWIHKTYVRAYFEHRAQEFRENPYYQDGWRPDSWKEKNAESRSEETCPSNTCHSGER